MGIISPKERKREAMVASTVSDAGPAGVSPKGSTGASFFAQTERTFGADYAGRIFIPKDVFDAVLASAGPVSEYIPADRDRGLAEKLREKFDAENTAVLTWSNSEIARYALSLSIPSSEQADISVENGGLVISVNPASCSSYPSARLSFAAGETLKRPLGMAKTVGAKWASVSVGQSSSVPYKGYSNPKSALDHYGM